jgi:hypothetical protein
MKIFVLLCALGIPITVLGDSPLPRFVEDVRAVRTAEPIAIDGLLDESAWKGTPITSFYQMDPNQGEPVTEGTEVWVVYDERLDQSWDGDPVLPAPLQQPACAGMGHQSGT